MANPKKTKKSESFFQSFEEESLPNELFIVPIKIRPIFPGIITPLLIPPGKFSIAIDQVYRENGLIGLFLYKQDKQDENESNIAENLYPVGTLVRVLKKIILPDGGTNILINSLQRVKMESIKLTEPFLVANVKYPEEHIDGPKNYLKALIRTLMILSKELAQNNPLFTEEMKLTLVNMSDPGKMADFICSILNLERNEYQEILEIHDIGLRLERVIIYLKKEIELVALQRKINEQINDKMDKQQRQFYLKEQLKAIQGELGIPDEKSEKKYIRLIQRLKDLKVDSIIIKEVEREIEKLKNSDHNSGDYNVIRNYLDTIESLPWEEPPQRTIDIKLAKKILNRDHYKLDDIKTRILEFLAVKKLNPSNTGTILCFVGPPGVGKTSIARSIAESLGRKFYRFSLGGVRDEAEIKGHRRTYIGSMPGKIITALRLLKEKDPVILLDEIDKLSNSAHGDPASALLEVLDPEQNITFRDHYLDLPFDLSKVLFIATANNIEHVPRVLADRMDVMYLSGYITEEKVEIFNKYLWKKIIKKDGIEKIKLRFEDDAVVALINSYSREAGLRGLEKMVDKIARKIAYKVVKGEKIDSVIKKIDLETFLGIPVYTSERMTIPTQPGMALGLAWTSVGGATLLIEAIFIKGKGGITLTGKLGKTMNESAFIALNHVRSILDDDSIFNSKRIHLHVPDGATPKDGPSAGITMAITILSLALNRIVPAGYGMTGELTLTGEVLPIGGLREKLVAARRANISNIIIPKDNEPNLKEIPSYIQRGLKISMVTKFSEVIEILFGKIKLNTKK